MAPTTTSAPAKEATSRFQPRCRLLTLGTWDAESEVARWALDLFHLPHWETPLPWGLHYWETVAWSGAHSGTSSNTPGQGSDASGGLPHDRLPILVTEQGEVYKRSVRDILVYLYAQTARGANRIYAAPENLELQDWLERRLAPATTTLFLHHVLASPQLTRKYLLDTVSGPVWRALTTVTWPLLRRAIPWYFGRVQERVVYLRAWTEVEEVFEQVGRLLALRAQERTAGSGRQQRGGAADRTYLTREGLQVVDMVFACHAALALCPNPGEGHEHAERLGLVLPALSELPPEAADRIRRLRATPAGQYALRLVAQDRPLSFGFRTKPPAPDSPLPWYARERTLRRVLVGGTLAVLVFVLACLTLPTMWYAWVASMVLLQYGYRRVLPRPMRGRLESCARLARAFAAGTAVPAGRRGLKGSAEGGEGEAPSCPEALSALQAAAAGALEKAKLQAAS